VLIRWLKETVERSAHRRCTMKLIHPHLLLTSAAVAAAGCAHGGSADSKQEAESAVGVRRVLEALLVYDHEATPNPLGPLGDGELVGSGGGEVTGALKGSMRWSLYERRDVGDPSRAPRCAMYFVGTVRTDDGSTIPFEGRGYAVSRTETWSVAGAFAFQPPDSERYAWLRHTALSWLGEFDPQAGTSRYAIYKLSESPAEGE
jgi:hypothetical protein